MEPVIDEFKKGAGELLILSVLSRGSRHGYHIAREISRLSRGAVNYKAASLYPLLYRMEKRAWIEGRWIEKPGQRRRRFYHLTDKGKQVLEAQSRSWKSFVQAIERILEVQHA